MRGRTFLLLAVVLAIPGLFWGGERYYLHQAHKAGVSWDRLDRGLDGYVFHRVGLRGFEAAEARIEAQWPLRVRVEGVDLDVSGLLDSSDGVAMAGGGLPPVSLSGVVLRWGEKPLATDVSGSLEGGRLLLESEKFQLDRSGGKTVLAMEVESPLEGASGVLNLGLEVEERRGVLEVQSDRLVLEHETLADVGLPISLSARVHLDVDENQFEGTVSVGEVKLEASGVFDEGRVPVRLVLPETGLEKVIDVLRPIVPEAEGARLSGQVSGWLEWQWPEGTWRADGSLHELGVVGAVPRIEALAYGPFEYRVRAEEDSLKLRTTGEGTPGWTALPHVAPSLSDAIVAAEDSGFLDHPGYDVEAMREALQANLEAGKILRGGSTITQQLAKNLFLDSERTLARKVSELLLAVELDRVLGKTRVMELYVNVVEWGPDLHGVAEASQRYFLRAPRHLQTHESAFLAAILPAPLKFYTRWYLKGRAGEYRIGWVLQNMVDGKRITPVEARTWMQEPLRFVPPPVVEADSASPQ
ncbi:MAG: biosynthetic peptidoglycan transglycosylase [Myxococcota bacterium]|nr:biosynthetic peptidoglycan transglycosylase [Myxococcota bacterium]